MGYLSKNEAILRIKIYYVHLSKKKKYKKYIELSTNEHQCYFPDCQNAYDTINETTFYFVQLPLCVL